MTTTGSPFTPPPPGDNLHASWGVCDEGDAGITRPDEGVVLSLEEEESAQQEMQMLGELQMEEMHALEKCVLEVLAHALEE